MRFSQVLANFAAMEKLEMTTDKNSCRILVEILQKHGVREAVISPGSRNAPIIVALTACPGIKKTVIVDERSAAFVALGKASILNEPVVLVCTSGTALLNYAPAVAEAYYRNLPLVVVSADRPMEWIDQDDSQTLRQFEALAHYVKRSYNLPAPCESAAAEWYVNRVVNDAMINCMSGRRAPVHINVQLDAPLNGFREICAGRWTERTIEMFEPELRLADAGGLAEFFSLDKKVLVIGGFHDPSDRLSAALESLAGRGNAAVMVETISNLRSPLFIDDIDATLSSMSESELEEMRPDVVVTFGGAIVSRFVKAYLRKSPALRHVHVGLTDNTVDCFQQLTMRIPMCASDFFPQLVGLLPESEKSDLGYRDMWDRYADRGRGRHAEYVRSAPWSDLKAMDFVMSHLPGGCALQLSNGTSVRYAQLFPSVQTARSDCNRGVSGIDGCTSTAIGAATAFDGMTVLVTGDMCAQYDMGAFALPCIPRNFKMVVLCNGGGGIFRFISSTSSLPQLEDYFAVPRPFPLRELSVAYGFAYFEADSTERLQEVFDEFIGIASRPAVLALRTPPELSAEILKGYFRQ